MAFFGINNSTSFFQPISFDTSILAGAFNAKLALSSANSLDARLAAQIDSFRGPDVIPPWKIPTEPRSLGSRTREARLLENFIDLRSEDARRAGDDVDTRALFALYNGLTALQSLAQFAAEDTTPGASLDRLNAKFQQGFAEINNFIKTAELEKLTLIQGEKSPRVESSAGLGRNSILFNGEVFQAGGRDDVLDNIVGDEVFTVRLTKNGETDDVIVDLSEITGTISANTVVDLINEKIKQVILLDGNGQPKLNGNGDTIQKYRTRFAIISQGFGNLNLRINGSSTETIRLIPQTATPALIIAGNTTGFNDDFSKGLLTKLSGLNSADPSRSNFATISGTDRDAEAIAALAQADAEEGDISEPASTIAATRANNIAVDSEDNLYVVGRSQGSFGSQINVAEEGDVFLTKFDSRGNVIYSRLLGASSDAEAFSVTIDSEDNVIIAGQTDSKLSARDVVSGTDSFVTKFNSRGDQIFTYQLDTFSEDGAFSVTTDANNDIFVTGYTRGAISSTSGFGGSRDGFILKLDGTAGILQSSSLFGGSGSEEGRAIAIAADGNILVAGVENGVATLKKFDATDLSNEIFSTTLGSLNGGTVSGIVVEGNSVFVTGSSSNAAFGSGNIAVAHSGGVDGFVVGLNDSGASASLSFTTFVGSGSTDRINSVTINNGSVYVAGETNGAIQGQTKSGLKDAFAAKINATTGAIDFVEQFGLSLADSAGAGIAFVNNGTSVLDKLGLATGTINLGETRDVVTQTSVRDGDHFFISIDGRVQRKITIETGDTFKTIARKINLLSFRNIKATVGTGSDGATLKIEARDGATIDIIAGTKGRDALSRLGLAPSRILSLDILFDLSDDDIGADVDNLGGSFAFGLPGNLHLRDKTTAKFSLKQIDDAIATVKRAFRSLTFDPIAAGLKRQAAFSGSVSPRIAAQIAGFQTALFRLQALNQSLGFNTFV